MTHLDHDPEGSCEYAFVDGYECPITWCGQVKGASTLPGAPTSSFTSPSQVRWLSGAVGIGA